MTELQITTESGDGWHRVVPVGAVDLAVADKLRAAIVEIAGSTALVDLSGVTFMDSSGIAALVAARREVEAGGKPAGTKGRSGRRSSRVPRPQHGGLADGVVTCPRAVRGVVDVLGVEGWIGEWRPETTFPPPPTPTRLLRSSRAIIPALLHDCYAHLGISQTPHVWA